MTKTNKQRVSQVVRIFPMEIKTEPIDEVTLEEPRFEDGGLIIPKEETFDDVTINIEQQHYDDQEDVEFLDSLLLDMQRMTSKQRKMFKQEMLVRLK